MRVDECSGDVWSPRPADDSLCFRSFWSDKDAMATLSVLPMMSSPVMLRKQVRAKIAVEIPPDRMNVIGVILYVVVLDEEGWPLNPVVVRLPMLKTTGPGKVYVVESRRPQFLHPCGGNIRSHVSGVFLQQAHQDILLLSA